jgi:hypothetical protein
MPMHGADLFQMFKEERMALRFTKKLDRILLGVWILLVGLLPLVPSLGELATKGIMAVLAVITGIVILFDL